MSRRKTPQVFSQYLYRLRNLVERFVNKIINFRAVATRYDKRADIRPARINQNLVKANKSMTYGSRIASPIPPTAPPKMYRASDLRPTLM